MTKRLLALTLVIVLCLAFAACGSSEPTAPADTTDTTETDEIGVQATDLVPLTSEVVTLEFGDNTITFNTYDNTFVPVAAIIDFEDFSAKDSSAVILYLIVALSEKYDYFEISGTFCDNPCRYVYTAGELNAAISEGNPKWYDFGSTDEFASYMTLWHAEDIEIIDAAVAKL